MANHSLERRVCAICKNDNAYKIGIRGNREYNGADISVEPHIVTDVVRCKVCDFIYTNPEIRGLEHLERAHYNNPESYMKEMEEGLSKMFATRINLLKKLAKPSQKRLLDIGAGKGEFVKEAITKGFNAIGVEPSPKFCKYGNDKLGVTLHQGFLNEIDILKSETYDIITLNHVLEHVEEPNSLLSSFHDYLNKDGVIFIEVPNCDSYFLRIADLFFKFKGLNWSTRLSPLHPPFHKFGYTPKSLQYVLKNNNFELVKMLTYSGKDRASHGKKGILNKIASTLAAILDLFGNRELLCVLAKKNTIPSK